MSLQKTIFAAGRRFAYETTIGMVFSSRHVRNEFELGLLFPEYL